MGRKTFPIIKPVYDTDFRSVKNPLPYLLEASLEKALCEWSDGPVWQVAA